MTNDHHKLSLLLVHHTSTVRVPGVIRTSRYWYHHRRSFKNFSLAAMETRGDTWRQVETRGDKWRQVETSGDKWRQMETSGDKWRQVETNGDKWRQMETNGDKWRQVATSGKNAENTYNVKTNGEKGTLRSNITDALITKFCRKF